MEKEYKVSGYSFSDVLDYKEAKRESETIEYIKANTDLNDKNKVLKLYHKLVERKTLNTIVGYGFLKELRDEIIGDGIINKENLPGIPIEKKSKQNNITSPDHNMEVKNHKQIQEYRIRHRNSRIINLFLILIIFVMIIINVMSDRSLFQDYEEKIVNRYASWEEDLTEREKELEEKK